MILSISHNFLFIHVPKTAGTAMTAALQPFGVTGTRTYWRRLIRHFPIREAAGKAYFRKHETAADIRTKMGNAVFERLLKFTVVRNPFDHAVSHYEYLKEFRNPKLAARFAAMSFLDYLDWRMMKHRKFVPFFTVLPDQAHWLVDRQGRMLVDRVMRFETLAADFAALTYDLGLGDIAMARINPTKAKAPGRTMQSYYDATALERVRQLYARDFDLFGYARNLPQP